MLSSIEQRLEVVASAVHRNNMLLTFSNAIDAFSVSDLALVLEISILAS